MKLLFICTHNRCRSILCEAIASQRGHGVLQAASAGSAPVSSVHPLTLRYLRERGYETFGLTSQSWNDLEAFEPDRVITVCDSAAGEVCPLWMGNVEKWHWGLPDPSGVEGDGEVIRDAFMSVIDRIEGKVDEWMLAARP
ncbi:arsenate reductase ArsC [Luminiphilus sp.]|nr:arsenate reductase ArsC [Luminiphilus sp.]